MSCLLLLFSATCFSQLKKIELFRLVNKLVQDSSADDTPGDWAVGSPSVYPIKWKSDMIEMSDDMKINFFRKGTVNISINNVVYTNQNIPMNWNLMLKGPRMGFTSFSIESAPHKNIKARTSIDSLFGKNLYSYKLLQDCSSSSTSGFYYYQFKIPKKVMAWMKVSWKCVSGNCSIGLDLYDGWSKQYADLACAK